MIAPRRGKQPEPNYSERATRASVGELIFYHWHAIVHPHRRCVYFLDPDGNDWEFVECLSAERNDDQLPS